MYGMSPQMLSRMYVAGSLQNQDGGFAFSVKNTIDSGSVSGLAKIAIDDSVEQTIRIIAFQKKQRSGCIDIDQARAIRELWRGAQAALEPAPVVIPFAEAISFPTAAIPPRTSRPHPTSTAVT